MENEKELSEFYKHLKMKDGHLGKCIECTKADVNKHRDNNIEAARARDRKRYETQPHRKELLKKYCKSKKGKETNKKSNQKYLKKYPQRFLVRNMVTNAVRDKRLIKGPCKHCGATEKIQGHHEDYYKPLEVTWLCPRCHKKLHKLKARRRQ